MLDILHYDFIRNALLAGILVSIACGIVGTLVVVNRLSFLSGGIAHSAYGGLGLAAYLKWPPLAGAILFTSFASLVLGAVTMKKKGKSRYRNWCGLGGWDGLRHYYAGPDKRLLC